MTEPHRNLKSLWYVVYFTLLLWVIKSAEVLFGLELSSLAVHPQDFNGLVGIIFAPMLHADWEHLIANSLPLLLLGALMVYGYPVSKWKTLLIIWVVSGLGVWLFGRPNYHLGASGIVSGLFYFIFLASIIRRDRVSIAIMFIAVFMYGGLLLGILPWDPKISFESHFFGAVGGAFSAILFRNQDPKPIEKTYDWENEDELALEYSDETDEYWKR
ncbi:rhomboid family intramembrane serine protease [Aliikangiella marina]|uniref:Rhomboid family intramembrane serine protease n=1 Tax=Aliikangiella marina TaxID=1712262 RepID=A0A545TJ28_9GAMM|nr:rhomboid family intramembrane serine protease [Aliikangiella marina]TQV77207.1 rhomboid family intramembrane serine protease [Aliikangiella marina]